MFCAKGEESVTELFQRLDVDPEAIRKEIEGERVFVERISSTAELPLSEESKKVLAYAAHEAESMLHSSVGSEHLLDRSSSRRGLCRNADSHPLWNGPLQRT